MKHLRWIVILILGLVAVILAVQNYESLAAPISFRADLGVWTYQSRGMPVSLVAVITFLVGLLASGLYGIVERFRLVRQIKGLQKALRDRDQELNSLRNLPVTVDDTVPPLEGAIQPKDV